MAAGQHGGASQPARRALELADALPRDELQHARHRLLQRVGRPVQVLQELLLRWEADRRG